MSSKGSDYYDDSYFDLQKKVGERSGRILSKIFQKYIQETDSILDFGCGGPPVSGYLSAQ